MVLAQWNSNRNLWRRSKDRKKGLALSFRRILWNSNYCFFNYRFLLFDLKCARRLSATDQAWWLWYDALLPFYLTCWSCSSQVDMVSGACFVGRSTQTQGYLRMKGQWPWLLWLPLSSTTLCWRLLRHPEVLSFGKLPLSLHCSFDVLLWYPSDW